MDTERHPFSLSSLLWFVLAFAAYASQLAFFFDADWGKDWRTPATVLMSWVILSNFYLAKDLRQLFAVHCLGPYAYVTLAMIFLPEERSFLTKLTDGCFLGNQVSFLIFLVMISSWIFIYFWCGMGEFDGRYAEEVADYERMND